jgi:uncharacterized protein DUF6084
MPDLSFEIISANPARDVIAPALAFDLRVTNRFPEESIQAILLRYQIQLEVARRRYTPAEQAQVHDLFDDPARWGDTLRPITWVNTCVNIPAFAGTTVHPITAPCTFDLNVATTKYFYGLEGGEVPLMFLFSGSVFFSASSALRVAPIPWTKEARFRLPLEIWKSLIDLHYPNAVCLTLDRDVFNKLYRFKVSQGLASFEDAIRRILAIAQEERALR